MADRGLRLPTNADGDFFVDSTCIDCDACRWIAPATFARRGEQSAVQRQPASPELERRALMALVSCPTASIGTALEHRVRDAIDAYPEPIDDGVHHCGFHSEQSFGAASYLIVRERGNVLVDSPRFAGRLVQRIEALGGIATMFLTHSDDIADHAKFRAHFGCERVVHRADAGSMDVERTIDGTAPVPLDDETVLIPVPGHTEGSTALLYRDRFLFTGDHLAWSESHGHVYAFRDACWWRWDRVITSTERLLDHRFEWILPGHGRRCRFAPDEMRAQLATAIAWMRSVA